MATHRNKYMKVILFEPVTTNLVGATIVGQYGDWLLVERPQPVAKKAAPVSRKPRAAKGNSKPSAATSFPPAEAQHGA